MTQAQEKVTTFRCGHSIALYLGNALAWKGQGVEVSTAVLEALGFIVEEQRIPLDEWPKRDDLFAPPSLTMMEDHCADVAERKRQTRIAELKAELSRLGG